MSDFRDHAERLRELQPTAKNDRIEYFPQLSDAADALDEAAETIEALEAERDALRAEVERLTPCTHGNASFYVGGPPLTNCKKCGGMILYVPDGAIIQECSVYGGQFPEVEDDAQKTT